MSTVLEKGYEIGGIHYKRISMLDSLELQKIIVGLIIKSGIGKEENKHENDTFGFGVSLISTLYENIEDAMRVFEIVLDKEKNTIESLNAGDEIAVIDGLSEHPDFIKLIERIKNLKESKIAGKIKALMK